jgi:diaminopimelate decarboxylase
MYKIFDHNTLAKTKIKTPYYLYDQALLLDTLKSASSSANDYIKNPFCIHYAVKANDNPQILKIIKNNGFSADCVSSGEVKKSLSAGFNSQSIVFAGVGKTDSEIKYGLRNKIYAFNTESIEEIITINKIAKKENIIASIMVRINPNIDAKTHKKISTGKYNNKFGITFNDFINFLPEIKELKNINFIGLHYHIGSQIIDLNIFKDLVKTINKHYKKLQNLEIKITDLDICGGLGVNYQHPKNEPIPNFADYFKTIATNLGIAKDIRLHFELGRSLVAQCGIIVSSVLFTKNTADTNFAIIDAGMNNLMRPALYNAKHKISKINQTKNKTFQRKYNIVGPICESSDIFATNYKIVQLNRGDKVAIYTTGAYGYVLSNTYNSRKKIKEYIV